MLILFILFFLAAKLAEIRKNNVFLWLFFVNILYFIYLCAKINSNI